LLVAVALAAVSLAIGLECLRLRRLSAKYRYIAWAIGNDVRSGLISLVDKETILRRLKASTQAEGHVLSDDERAALVELPIGIEQSEAFIAASANLVQLFEHAAAHPWEAPPEIVEPNGGVRNAPIVQRFLTTPAAPPPSKPPEFTTPTDDSPPPPPPPPPPPRSPNST
jgi:hypothetical protein